VVLNSPDRQPIHVVYGGAQLFKAETPARLGTLALELIRKYTPDASSFAECLGLPPGELADAVFERTVAKLEREPVEDFRIDFEDGYGYRSNAEEDGHAVSSAQFLTRGAGKPGFPPRSSGFASNHLPMRCARDRHGRWTCSSPRFSSPARFRTIS
jgi:hypothetical protein